MWCGNYGRQLLSPLALYLPDFVSSLTLSPPIHQQAPCHLLVTGRCRVSGLSDKNLSVDNIMVPIRINSSNLRDPYEQTNKNMIGPPSEEKILKVVMNPYSNEISKNGIRKEKSRVLGIPA